MAKVQVKNRSTGTAVYVIPELGDRVNIRREFAPHEVKLIDEAELEALTFVPGGSVLLEDYLQVLDEKVKVAINVGKEPEYDMSEEDIKALMTTGSLDAFLDCLDFAPDGVIDLIKKFAVDLPLNDTEKRAAILKKTGFDVDKAVVIKREALEAAAGTSEEKTRRVQAADTGRRTTAPNYKVVTKN